PLRSAHGRALQQRQGAVEPERENLGGDAVWQASARALPGRVLPPAVANRHVPRLLPDALRGHGRRPGQAPADPPGRRLRPAVELGSRRSRGAPAVSRVLPGTGGVPGVARSADVTLRETCWSAAVASRMAASPSAGTGRVTDRQCGMSMVKVEPCP